MSSTRLRTTAVLLLAVLVGVFVLGKLLEVSAPVKAAPEGKKSGRISVNGEGKIKVEPNVVKAEIGVETEAKTAEKAQSENTQKMKQVIVVLKRSGIASQDIQTSEFFLEPDYDEEDGNRQVIVGYHAINYVSVEAKEVEKFGEILDKAVKAGANGARSISFSVTDSKAKQLKREARRQAVKEARDKAEALAKLTGVRVGKPTSISESQVSPVYEQKEMAFEKAQESVPIEAGQVEIVLNVQITYELLTD